MKLLIKVSCLGCGVPLFECSSHQEVVNTFESPKKMKAARAQANCECSASEKKLGIKVRFRKADRRGHIPVFTFSYELPGQKAS